MSEEGGPFAGRRGWLAVAVLFVFLVVAPLVVLFRPPTFLGFQDAYLAVSVVPGLALGAVAVWAAVRARA